MESSIVFVNHSKKNCHKSKALKNRHYEKLEKTEIATLKQTRFLFHIGDFQN